MSFSLPDHWTWDIWLADDGDRFHLFYLHAPHALGDPDLRHRNARIGHATSQDLTAWTDHGRIFDAGAPGSFDASATWTGSVVQAQDGLWHMLYTGSVFTDPATTENIETIGRATSPDLSTWKKHPGPVLTADPRWYETLGHSSWPEEAWRDPWVWRDDAAGLWRMLITARSRDGGADDSDRGIVGQASSSDLQSWTAGPPLSQPGAGFGHLEVLQIVVVEGQRFLIFSCDAAKLAGHRAGQTGGIWSVHAPDPEAPFDISTAELICSERLYAGRIQHDREGTAMLLAFENAAPAGGFGGRLADPVPLRVGQGRNGPRLEPAAPL
ncbi:glycosyl hydrolase family 32 [Mesobaculum littorinae]|uniref:beta-fructofuranosidase n=1 Tax=Mesobaculum littorinae TaxID=2486419 RepID=A0A438AH43_9RHOB|nr:glycosyl hydrolase family 32 [Mesobaculum littorinae]RVV98039.1 glycosyl hydrolase family 32 [Mesobaculum littorinae]